MSADGRRMNAGAWSSLARVARLHEGEGRRLALSVLLAFGAVGAAMGLLAASGYLISRAAQRPEILELTAAITAVRGFGVARAGLRYAERLVSHDLALRVLARLRSGFYMVLAPLGAAALGHRRQGDLLARFVGDVDSLQDLYLRALAPPLVAVLVIVTAGTAAAIMLPAAAAVLVTCLLIAALVAPLVTAAIAASSGRRQAAARAVLTDELVEALEGSVELAVAGRAPERVARITRASDRLTSIARRDALAASGATMLSSLFVGLTVTALLVVAIPAADRGSLSVVLLAAVVLLAMGAFEALQPLPLAAARLRACAEAARRLNELEALAPAVADPLQPHWLPIGPEAGLRLEHARLTYPDGTTVLADASLELKPGCRIALTGPSGTGKTSLAELLVRFSDPVAGRVTFGGVDLRELTLEDVRRTVVLVAQDAHVFTTTIRENLLLARRDATDDELWDALRAVRLADWAASLPDGLDALVGEDGGLLSGGQRQRLTVARALVADARFIVLDEPTAHLDHRTATELIAGVSEAAGDRGLLVITHRVADVAGFDAIYALQDGRLRVLSSAGTISTASTIS